MVPRATPHYLQTLPTDASRSQGRVQSNLVIEANFHNGPPLRAQKGPTQRGLHWLDHVHDF